MEACRYQATREIDKHDQVPSFAVPLGQEGPWTVCHTPLDGVSITDSPGLVPFKLMVVQYTVTHEIIDSTPILWYLYVNFAPSTRLCSAKLLCDWLIGHRGQGWVTEELSQESFLETAWPVHPASTSMFRQCRASVSETFYESRYRLLWGVWM